jgi:predicted nucleotidyltransferase
MRSKLPHAYSASQRRFCYAAARSARSDAHAPLRRTAAAARVHRADTPSRALSCSGQRTRLAPVSLQVYNRDEMLKATDLPVLCRATLERATEVQAAFVFGSVARSAARPDSDVDIAVVGRGVDTLQLGATLGTVLGRETDVVEVSLQTAIPLLRSLLRDGLPIFQRHGGAAGEFLSRARSVVDLDGPGHDRMMRAFMRRVAERGVGR